METHELKFESSKSSSPKHARRWFWVRLLPATILLIAATMKVHQLLTTPSVGDGLLDARWFNLLIVDFELFLALWLFVGTLPGFSWLTTLVCFSIFASVSLWKAFSGEVSCGCFGTAVINPWATAFLDLCVVGLLICVRPIENVSHWREALAEWSQIIHDRKTILFVLVFWVLIAAPTTLAIVQTGKNRITALGAEYTGLDGKRTILLEPGDWLGKEFPLVSRFVHHDSEEKLKKGVWNILMIHADCPKCLQLVSDLENREEGQFACVKLPSHSTDLIVETSFLQFELDDKNDWFVQTPCVIKLKDGICVATGDDIIN